ncbi:MAG: GNAT family N-acetyltransferase [Myxococcales bacterium]
MVGKSQEIRVVQVKDEGDLASALAIREIVFIEEQRVPESLERDEEDSRAYHVLAYEGGHAIGTGRLVPLTEPPPGETGRWGKIGRMAVLVAHRKGGVGRRILLSLEEEARRQGLDGIILHAQLHAHEFYLRNGYRDTSPIFEEAGMPHVQMRKLLLPVATA